MSRRFVAAASLFALAVMTVAAALWLKQTRAAPSQRLDGLPKLMVWAWERPEDLRFLNPQQVGVAFLAKTLYLRGPDVVSRPRLQPLQIPDGMALMAVVRIEPDRAELSSRQATNASATIAETARLPGVRALQVDFDATLSQRAFYRWLLDDLRREAPESTPLSITALASWCLGDDWLSPLPIDEAVPMLFRMGVGARQVVTQVQAGNDFRPAVCRSSIGISTDEGAPPISGRRVYIFHPQPWSKEAFDRVTAELKQ